MGFLMSHEKRLSSLSSFLKKVRLVLVVKGELKVAEEVDLLEEEEGEVASKVEEDFKEEEEGILKEVIRNTNNVTIVTSMDNMK